MRDSQDRKRRQYERHILREDVLINGWIRAYCQNICESGMFLCTLQPFEEDSVIDVSIPSELTVKAIVRNHQPGIGMGVEFLDLDGEQKMMIRRLIDEKHEASKKSALNSQ